MSMFDRMDRIISRTVDRTFSVRFHCDPMTSTPNSRRKPDSQRASWEGKGILDENPVPAGIEIGKRDRRGNDLHTLVSGNALELSVDRHRFPEAATARQGDEIVLDDMRRCRIASVKPDGLARIVFVLTQI